MTGEDRSGVGTRLGFGASGPWAMTWFAEEKAESVLRAALGAGVTDIDTGPSYAKGNAEPRLGRLLTKLGSAPAGGPDGVVVPDRLRVTSKVGTQLGEGGRLVKDFRAETIHRQAAASLAALRVRQLDVFYLHGPDEHQLASALPELNKLQQSGMIKAIGVVADDVHVSRAAAEPAVDWIMAPYNALNQNNGPALRAAKAAGKKISVVAPLAQALWRRDILVPRTPSGLWYAARAVTRNRDTLRAARRAAWLREVPGWSPAALSLAFVREALAPDLILTTTTNPAHVAESAAALSRPVPPDLAARLQGLIVS